jgi:protein-tyrosine phosphatase
VSIPADPAHVVFVCTANQCRSPMAEALMRQALAERGIENVGVSSAGLFEGGIPATPAGVRAVATYGADLSGHRSRFLSGDVVDSADLVLAMTRDHAAEVLALRPDAAGRTATLRTLVRRAEAAGPRRGEEDLPNYLARLPSIKAADEDIPDPIGRSSNAHAATAAELHDLIGRLVSLLWDGRQ